MCVFNNTAVEESRCPEHPSGAYETKSCNEDMCLTWSSWEFGPCNAPCDVPSYQIKTRTCKFATVGNQIFNNPPGVHMRKCTTEVVPCLGKCRTFWAIWSPWSRCTETCGTGVNVRRRKCYNEGTLVDPEVCTPDTNVGSSAHMRTRLCNTAVCDSWTQWTAGKCSRECGGFGRRHKQRVCNGTGTRAPLTSPANELSCYNVIEDCGLQPCLVEYSQWLPWTRCTAPCGPGIQTRRRFCRNLSGGPPSLRDCLAVGPVMERRRCNPTSCNSWGPWTNGICQGKCDSAGTVTRSRECNTAVDAAMKKKFSRCIAIRRTCFNKKCRGRWDDSLRWSPCSVTCGQGLSRQIRRCVDPITDEEID